VGTEYTEVERPAIEILKGLGYRYISPEENAAEREELNHVILQDTFLKSVQRINGIDADTARAVYADLLQITDNERWTHVLRGDYSRNVPGQTQKKTIRLIDFKNAGNNTFTVTSQFKVQAEKNRIADLVCFINGIPLVVIEAKSPFSQKSRAGEAFDQIKQYERDIPRLFYSNLFNIITDSDFVLYGATGAASQYWGRWRDPWPKEEKDFHSPLALGLYSLLEPSRLLDILAHFVVFETDDNQTIKKMCRYQQYRAVNRIVERVLENRPPGERQGLVWHTQGSGKSLTMVFTALKLKTHLTLDNPVLASPNILVLTDRIDLDDQISKTFQNCGMRNPERVGGRLISNDEEDQKKNPDQVADRGELNRRIHGDLNGLTLLSTIFKFEGSEKAVENSANWILLVDECHRTQEKDLGAYLRMTFPDAYFFGFTGTPIKKTDKDTYRNFSPPGEAYLDKYSIDDAVADGATIPIKYTSRMVNWHVDPSQLDSLFNNWFMEYSPQEQEAIRTKELTFGTILKHRGRVREIAQDMWNHFTGHCRPDGFKAQLVAIDREAIILYKRALDEVIAAYLVKRGMDDELAREEAATYTVPVFSPSQEDEKPSEDAYLDGIRKDLVKYRLADDADKTGLTEKAIKQAFKRKGEPPWILIVCSKLLTGFDAPAESVMYLDSPLKEHNLLQAIARTNRVEASTKEYGLILDYVGVTSYLDEALASYRTEDVQNAMQDLEGLRSELRQAHAEAMAFVKGIERKKENIGKADYQSEFHAFIKALGTEDEWLKFKRRAGMFLKLYAALSPDPVVLNYRRDCKWVGLFLMRGSQYFEHKEEVFLKDASAKVREMLNQELAVTGMVDLVKLRTVVEDGFDEDFVTDGKSEEELERAAVRKATELKKTISTKMADSPEQYKSFSQRLLEILERMKKNQTAWATHLGEMEAWWKDLTAEENAHRTMGLTATAYAIFRTLEALALAEPPEGVRELPAPYGVENAEGLTALQAMAVQIDRLYSAPETAPGGWEKKEELKKELRRHVKRLLHMELKYTPLKEAVEKVEEYALAHHVVKA